MKKAVDNARVHPVVFAETGFEVSGNVFDVTLAGRVKSGAKAAGPVLALSQKLDHFFGMRARFTSVTLLVVLVERVGAPEAAVAAWLWARILAPALMEFIFMSLPVIFALEAGLARGTPVHVLLVTARGRHLRAIDDWSAAGRGERGGHGAVAGTGLPGHGGAC